MMWNLKWNKEEISINNILEFIGRFIRKSY